VTKVHATCEFRRVKECRQETIRGLGGGAQPSISRADIAGGKRNTTKRRSARKKSRRTRKYLNAALREWGDAVPLQKGSKNIFPEGSRAKE